MRETAPPFDPQPPEVLQARLEHAHLQIINLMNDCPDGVSHDRAVYYGMAQGLLSALFLTGSISALDYELRRAGLEAEYAWGNEDDPQ
ncbi:hypothetical protein [Pseudomonas sp. UMAB-40]|uniref:hypothetical protein n=1 Tax=Pseudomonas sp. UMAB-40 TaxID=1365407 RepID=UPI001C57583C|nr:hypothetical protein [Pseudomonas sp. UMAB-40]